MKDPKLLASEAATGFERRSLSAARAEEPPPDVVNRIERALGLGSGAAAPQASQEVSTAAAKGGLSALRIAGLSVLGVGGAVGLVLLLMRPAPSVPPADRPPPVVESVPATPGPSIAAPAIPSPSDAPPADRRPSSGTGALRDEIALIDGARAALAAGSPGQALSLLERYRARHPHGMLLPEALAMRIEAIDRGGAHARARALARAFLAEYPQSPLAQRVAHIGEPDRN